MGQLRKCKVDYVLFCRKRLPFIVPTTVHAIKATEPCEYERDCTLVYDCELVGLAQVTEI